MRKYLSILMFFFISNNLLFSFELWNGLSTEMTKDEVLKKLSGLLEIDIKDSSRINNEINDPRINDELFKLKNVDTLYFVSPIRSYRQPKKIDGFKYNFVYDSNLICYFFEKKLFAVFIKWNTSLEELKRRTINQFDEPLDVIENGYFYSMYGSNNPDYYEYTYCFLTPDHNRAIFVGDVYKYVVSERNVADYLVVDYQALMSAFAKLQKIKDQKKEEDEINKKNDANAVKF